MSEKEQVLLYIHSFSFFVMKTPFLISFFSASASGLESFLLSSCILRLQILLLNSTAFLSSLPTSSSAFLLRVFVDFSVAFRWIHTLLLLSSRFFLTCLASSPSRSFFLCSRNRERDVKVENKKNCSINGTQERKEAASTKLRW